MSAKIYSRSSWGAKRPNGDKTLTNLADEVFLHHTVTKTLSEKATAAEEKEQMRLIESIGYSRFSSYGQGISYNVIIFPSGRAYQGVDFNRRGCHTDQRNSTARSICFAGNFETAKPTAAALETAAQILAEGYGKWWKKGAPLRGHRDIKSTACPGKNVYAKRAEIEKRAKAILNPPKPKPKPKPKPTNPPRISAPRPVSQRPWSQRVIINGKLDRVTIAAIQEALGLPISGGLIGMKTVDGKVRVTGPDLTVRTLQRRFRTTQDGNISTPESELVKALQRHFQTGTVDGYISASDSLLVRKMQRALRAGTF